jgi:lysozyme family protein
MTDTRFQACLAEVLRHEGGYADHPSDPGGATNMGITRKTLARWRRVSPWWNLPKSEVKALGQAEAAEIYRAGYWEASRAAEMPAGLDLALFDFAVNSGPSRAIRTLQAELAVKVDGIAGKLTLAAVQSRAAQTGVAALVDALCDRRLGFLRALATFPIFGRGWLGRIDAVRMAARAAAGARSSSSSTSQTWSKTLDFLNGYKTYIVAAFMLAAGIMQVLGIELPSLDGNAAGNLIMEALAVLFLRKGLKGDIAKA